MKTNFKFIAIVLMAGIFAGCSSSRLGEAVAQDQLKMKVKEQADVIDYASLKLQPVPDMAERAQKNRGPISGLAGGAISLATNAVKQMIAKDRKKYNADYSFGITDLYFYDQLSLDGPFDPLGMQFSGFTLLRTFQNKGKLDTAFVAQFELDATNPYEILNNSLFRLKLKSLQLNYARAKVPGNNPFLNMDFEISFHSSYVNNQGALFKDMELGKFYFFLRKAPLNPEHQGYAAYYQQLQGARLEGQSFIVPRSFGYHISGTNNAQPSYSQGAYHIKVKVKESSKNNFVNQLIIDNSGQLVDALGGALKKQLK